MPASIEAKIKTENRAQIKTQAYGGSDSQVTSGTTNQRTDKELISKGHWKKKPPIWQKIKIEFLPQTTHIH
jgi:hypothetical protein